jgi:alanyl-tRNA synthetase
MKTILSYYDTSIDTAEPFFARIVEMRPVKEGIAVILDRTVFYPEGGGQPGDRGSINGYAVSDVRIENHEILHLVQALAENTEELSGSVVCRLDTARRRDFTVKHTAQHLLSGSILRLTGAHTVSMHLGEEVCTVDVQAPELSEDTLATIEEAVADAIEADHPVLVHRCPPEDVNAFPLRKTPPKDEEVVRVVEIQDCDFSPCCGTHLSSTGPINVLHITGAEKYKGMTRLSFTVGREVLRRTRIMRRNAALASRLLKVPPLEIGAAVKALVEKMEEATKLLKAGAEKAARQTAETLVSSTAGAVVIGLLDVDIEEALRIAKTAQKLTDKPIIVVSRQDMKMVALCARKDVDMRLLVQPMLEDARGGGGPSFFQAAFPSPESLSVFWEKIKKWTRTV